MAKARAIVKRRKASQNIKRITGTMQLVATARFAKCLQRATASKPYVEKITEMIESLSGQSVDHPLLRPNASQNALVMMMTSNRGLAGSYNSGLLRHGLEHYKRLKAEGRTVAVEMVGKKGVGYLKFLGIEMADAITDIEDKIAYARVAGIAERFMSLYSEGKVGRVDVCYTKYNSVANQRPTIVRLLPIEQVPAAQSADRPKKSAVEWEFSPPPEQLLTRLIPETVKIRLYQYFNDAILSEQVARMVAMKSATDAAGDMIKFLTRQYNRARQSQITLELADIVGGAEAVK